MAKLLPSIICLLALLSNVLSTPTSGATKVDFFLRKTLETKSRVNVLASMKEGTDSVLAQVARNTYSSRGEKATAVYRALNAHAAEQQSAVLEMLNSPRFFAITVKSFWITNQVYIQGADQYLIDTLAAMDEVSLIEEEETVWLVEPVFADPQNEVRGEWGIDKIQAPQAWAELGHDGIGAVVGVIDTGARYTHQAISGSFRGGTHSWYNPYMTEQTRPHDGHGQGTHVTGTIAGSLGIGVAPGAKWISCKGLRDDGSGTSAALISCGEFIACPTDFQGQNSDCSQAPDVCSNSWGGTGGSTWYNAVINAWHAVGVIPVFTNGHDSTCRTTMSPADSTAGVIAVGATTSTDAIFHSSARGPSNGGAQKPDVCAPGNLIRSAGITSDSAYATMSGTSMACPHTAGVAALLRSKDPNVTYTNVKNILQNTAERALTFSGQTCSGVIDSTFPNYTFGYGRINALSAVNALLKMMKGK